MCTYPLEQKEIHNCHQSSYVTYQYTVRTLLTFCRAKQVNKLVIEHLCDNSVKHTFYQYLIFLNQHCTAVMQKFLNDLQSGPQTNEQHSCSII